MTSSGIIAGIASAIVACCLSAADNREVVATIGNSAISRQQLDSAIGARLARIRTEEYNLRREVLDELITRQLIEVESARRGITTDELLKSEVEQKIVEPSAADIEPVYSGVADRFPGVTKEQALEQIADGMRRQRISNRRAEFVKQLLASANVRILLEPPRVAVSAEGPSKGNVNAPVRII